MRKALSILFFTVLSICTLHANAWAQEAPPAPDGFVASDMVGPNPVQDGEIFLAAGPNNVAEENIEYRLFYAPTADAPGNPQDATEYEFGTTPGDGEGISPFGFVLAGLEEATEYTFWLYQYNSAEDIFSEPAEASAVSGGDGDDPGVEPPAAPDGFVANDTDVDGEIFLAVGPNDVEAENIEYRLFYAPTADAPDNPQDATEYEFGSTPGDGEGNAAFGFNLGGLAEGTEYTFWLYQYDNAEDVFSEPAEASAVSGGDGDDPGVEPPAAPDGFVASDMIGPNPVGNGEVFLSVGPNDVEADNIEYRLFYAITEDAPGNPLDATEYEFGSTPGDGEGNAAFGFALGGLEFGTEYTFWLYQYDNAEDVFSEPAEASAVSGGDGDAPDPAPVGENIILNGDFEDGLANWTPFIADFEGVSADIDVVDGEAAITNIDGAGGEVWYVQFNQIFTDEQVGALDVSGVYKAEFDARSDVDGRQLRFFFGEEGGDFAAINVTDLQLSTDMETYEVFFEVPTTFPVMKLGFEMGLENDDVFIDNVSMELTDMDEPPMEPVSFPVTFDDPNVDYGLVDFGGNVSEIVEDPTDPTNSVVQSVKTEGSEIFAGTSVGEPDGFAEPIPFTEEDTFMSVRVWSPVANIPVRMKIEDAADPDTFVEAEMTTSVSEEWETLVFDFSNEVEGTPAIDFSNTYDLVTIFFDFGAQGGGETYFWDDIELPGAPTSSGNDLADVPAEFELRQNYPNPFNPTTQIEFSVPENADVRLDVYNVTGQRVATLVNESMSAGTHSVSFDAQNLASGIYLYRLQAGNTVLTRKMTLVK